MISKGNHYCQNYKKQQGAVTIVVKKYTTIPNKLNILI